MNDGLLHGENMLRRILGGIAEGVWIIDARGGTAYMNGKLVEILDSAHDELTEGEIFKFQDDGCRERIEERHLNLRRKDGGIIHLTVAVNPLFGEDGKYNGSIGVFNDITVIKNLEGQLRLHSEHLESLVKARTCEQEKVNRELQQELMEREKLQKDLVKRVDELERLNKVMIGRELDIERLKKGKKMLEERIAELEKRLESRRG